MLLQLTAAAGTHPLSGSVAEYLWALPLLPLLGFVINGLLSVLSAGHPGPSDPGLRHDDHALPPGSPEAFVAAHGAHDVHDATHGSTGSAIGDDHHPVARHRYAGIVSLVGPLVLALSFGLAAAMLMAMRAVHGMEEPFVQSYFRWMATGDLNIEAAFQLDQLSMVMVMIITGVGTLIHIFSVGYMRDDPGYPRYFAYLNLFVFFMLVLVLGANYPVMFVGWEGVGLCSYLLIGFWFSEKANADAGKKAFIVNRIGDFGFLVAMMLLFANLGTLDFRDIGEGAGALAGGAVITAICLFLFLGCAGKSAQIPLYVWLPDAMAGPTPVSALIHAATMVTAGVYLVARSAVLFSLSPVASLTVAFIGGLTALFAATIGLKQWDIKKVLAYSTVSQLGYMFVGVGIGAYTAGVFHLMTHAFFKALLFLGSGSVIYAMHKAYHHTHSHEDAQDMRNMGGLKRYMPWTWILMWIATLAIAGIPVLSGFFSKDEILTSVFARTNHSPLSEVSWLGVPGTIVLYTIYVMGLAAALLTAVYMTRMMLYTFHGPERTGKPEAEHLHEAPWVMTGPLVVLAFLSFFGGWFNIPPLLSFLGPPEILHHWLEPVTGESTVRLAGADAHVEHSTEWALIFVAVTIASIGILYAFVRLKPARIVPARDAVPETGFGGVLANKYYIDEAYDRGIIGPTVGVSRGFLWRFIDVGVIDGIVNGSASLARGFGQVGSWMQSGRVGTYAWVLLVGVLAVLGAFTFR
jgi:NADH-quinone oxidoreductase subunit L